MTDTSRAAGASFYDTYETADGKLVSIGAIEPQFYARLCATLAIADNPLFYSQHDTARWPAQKLRLTELFLSKTRAAWCGLMEHSDICFAPVLSFADVASHPHNAQRQTIIEVGGVAQPAPAPRYSVTTTIFPSPPMEPGEDQSLLDMA